MLDQQDDREIVSSFYVYSMQHINDLYSVLQVTPNAEVQVASRTFKDVNVGSEEFRQVMAYLKGCMDRDFVPWVVVRR